MNKWLLPVITVLLLSSNTTEAQEKKLPDELKDFVLKGYEVLDFIEGDLNADKRKDALLILKTPGEDTLQDQNLKRPFLILIRQSAGKLKQEIRNDNLILCAYCGGIFGDPYEGIKIEKNGFVVSFYGGSNWRWGYDYTFTYDISKNNWFLTNEHQLTFNSGDPETTTKECNIGAEELSGITVGKFNSDPPYVESKWTVVKAKSFFYDNPKLGSKPRKGYMIKGDTATAIRELKNFVEVSYKYKEDYTTGYVLKSTLKKIK